MQLNSYTRHTLHHQHQHQHQPAMPTEHVVAAPRGTNAPNPNRGIPPGTEISPAIHIPSSPNPPSLRSLNSPPKDRCRIPIASRSTAPHPAVSSLAHLSVSCRWGQWRSAMRRLSRLRWVPESGSRRRIGFRDRGALIPLMVYDACCGDGPLGLFFLFPLPLFLYGVWLCADLPYIHLSSGWTLAHALSPPTSPRPHQAPGPHLPSSPPPLPKRHKGDRY